MTRLMTLLSLLLCQAAYAATPAVFDHPATPAQLRVIITAAEQELAHSPVLRGQFTQIKTLQEIPAPLKSTGRFIISRAQGIYWHTLTPFDSEFILTPTQMLQVDSGKVMVRIDAATQPGLKIVGDVFFSIFNLDPAALASNFTLYGMPAGKGWTMGLRPLNSALAGVLTQAVITGDKRVSAVELLDAHGDRTAITLENTTSSAALTPQEAALFKQ
ncbi:MAG: outer membrane lipoprotein carrier protein LolA [Stenotrophobium sp.]